MSKDRLLFIDLMRILGIALILFYHVSSTVWGQWIWNYFFSINIFNLYYANYGTIGVSLFLFASGCSLALSCKGIETEGDLKSFYSKRLLRIYPAYWTGVLFAVMMDLSVLQKQFLPIDYARLVTGLQSLGATTAQDFYGNVNGNFWFLTPILFMYLLFPIIFLAVKKHPHLSILTLLAISVLSRWYMSSPIFYRGIDWFPLCVIFEFGLGIYLIKVGVYPKIRGTIITAYLSNLAFYAYLINAPLLHLFPYAYFFSVTLLVMASMMYTFDVAVRKSVMSCWNYIHSRPRLMLNE